MKAIHITPSTNGYELVEVVANPISRKNGMAHIKMENGEERMTGGILLPNTERLRESLDFIPKDKQYRFLSDFIIGRSEVITNWDAYNDRRKGIIED